MTDLSALEAALSRAVRGEVRFDAGSRAMYATDASNYRMVPLGVVLPRSARDVEATVEVCRAFDAAVLSRGGGTSLAGQACNAAVVIDFTKFMNAIVAIDWRRRRARVQPGCVTDDLRDRAERHHLTWGPDPATHNRNTFGGMIGNNSCGTHAQMAGKTEENVEELDILTYDGLRMRVGKTSEEELARIVAQGGRRGEIYAQLRDLRDRYGDSIREQFPKLQRRVSGFALDRLLPEHGFDVAKALVGTEGTCVTVLEATLRLVPSPHHRALAVLGFSDLVAAAERVPYINDRGPIAIEAIGESLFTFMQDKGMSTQGRSMLPTGEAWLMVEFGGDTALEARERARTLISAIEGDPHPPFTKLFVEVEEQRRLWEIRESALGATSKVPGKADFYPGWEDCAVPPERLAGYLREFHALLDRYDYHGATYGHFGQGCVHCSIDFDLFTAEGIAKYRRFVTEAAHLCVRYDGSLSGEHGDGQARGELLPILYGDELVHAFWEFKSIWDPRNRMNPGKVVRPRKLDEDLRWGSTYEPVAPKTHFSFVDDHGSFAVAANRCVGVGKCRRHDGGTMCPSYMVTKEEAYSTRGRARLLFEMLRGDPIRELWHDETVKDALDLCLACKGCKSECPVNVDMATYKAEFLAHYYEKKKRPIAAYLFGLMPLLARVASRAPATANAMANAPILAPLAKLAAGIALRRRIPPFAKTTFRAWFAQRAQRLTGRTRVILWPDTWNNYFHPYTAQAAVEVLEDAGFEVVVPRQVLCCGRPLYDYGMLDVAKRWLAAIVDELRDEVRAGTYVVGLEPSCVSVFRDELVNLFPNDEDARRLQSQTLLLTEFLASKAPDCHPQLAARALVHQHCHHKAVLDKDAQIRLFERMGVTCELPDTGCCGMAGAFGFDAAHYGVSVAVGERVLLPAVRSADERSIVVADGFSCREQIAQQTKRLALHPVEVIKMAIDGRNGNEAFPERRYVPDPRREAKRAGLVGALVLGALAAVAWVALMTARNR